MTSFPQNVKMKIRPANQGQGQSGTLYYTRLIERSGLLRSVRHKTVQISKVFSQLSEGPKVNIINLTIFLQTTKSSVIISLV